MTIKVIGAGFGRTGTLSLKHALERLGFEKAHHMLEVAKSREQIDHWTAIAKGDPVDWDRVFDGFQSTTDFPACVYYKELCTTYPDAKVILSVRDEDRWHTSHQYNFACFQICSILAIVPVASAKTAARGYQYHCLAKHLPRQSL